MSLRDDPVARDILERTFSAASDADRAALRDKLASRAEDEQRHWTRLLTEVETLRANVNDVPMPSRLQSRLLGLIDAPTSAAAHALARPATIADRAAATSSSPTTSPAFWRRFGGGSSWKQVAAAIFFLVAGSLAIYLNWPESGPQLPPKLNAGLTESIATLAINYHTSPLEVSSEDADKVLAGMKSHQLPFAPTLIKPRTVMTLLGEGVVNFKGKPAVFTRWTSKNGTFTVYQFDGKPLGVPESFVQTAYTPPNKKAHVNIWPGAEGCDWIVVADEDLQSNPFCESY